MYGVLKKQLLAKLILVFISLFGIIFLISNPTPVSAATKPIVVENCSGIDNSYQTRYKSPYTTTNYMCLGKEFTSDVRFYQFVVNLPGVIKDATVSAVNGNNKKIFFNNTGDDKTYVSIPSAGAGLYDRGMGYGASVPANSCNKNNKDNIITINVLGNKTPYTTTINLCSNLTDKESLVDIVVVGPKADDGSVGDVGNVIGEFGAVRDDPINSAEKYGLYQKEGIVKISLTSTDGGDNYSDKNGSWYDLVDGKFNVEGIKPGSYKLSFTYSDYIVAQDSSIGDVSQYAAEDLTFSASFVLKAGATWNLTPNGIVYKDTTNTVVVKPSDALNATSCAIDGVGWIICPVMNFMANIVDGAYGIVEGLLSTPALNTNSADPANGTYQAWSIMRTFANVAFVIAFLLIIFSQLTSIGINNYGVKKLLPRIVIAAILVNVSYFICAIAVDASNIIGSSVKTIFDNIAGQISTPDFTNVGATGEGWVGIVGFLLAGAGAASLILYSGLSVLLPGLIAALVAIVTVFLVLTLRQALIIILIVISPLAFVAFLLPNTEDLFKKWRKLFTTLLLMFPIIAGIFGASALASKVIMASDTANFFVQIMGALVAIIPLFITPIVMKTAGGVLSRFGGFVNNPNKGPFDFMRKRADQYRENRQGNRAIRAANGGRVFGGGQFRRSAKRSAEAAGIKEQKGRAEQKYVAEAMGTTENPTAFAKRVAGGGAILGADPAALQRALAGAQFTIEKAELEDVKAAHAEIDKLDGASLSSIIQNSNGANSEAKVAAAIERFVKIGHTRDVAEVVNKYGTNGQNNLITKTLASSLAQDGPQSLKASDIDNIAHGQLGKQIDDNGVITRISANFATVTRDNVAAGVYSQEKMVTAANDDLEYAQEVSIADAKAMLNLRTTAAQLKNNPTLSGKIKHNKAQIDRLAPASTPVTSVQPGVEGVGPLDPNNYTESANGFFVPKDRK